LSRLKRTLVAALASALMLSVMATPALAFHHTGLPSTTCAADQAGSPSNDNGMAKENLTGTAGLTLPLPPVGTPGDGQGEGAEFCAAV
jgi:hypothetical protein